MYCDQVANWLEARFVGLGYSQVSLHGYTRDGFQRQNVVCTKAGVGGTGRVILVCGHYDSRMEDLGDATARAPGADDNATGVAILLEVARILAQVELRDAVQFIAFSGEEQGYWGSTAYAQHVQANGIDVQRLINLDQVGYPPTDLAVIVERDLGNAVASNDAPSQAFGGDMAQMAADSIPRCRSSRGPIYGSHTRPLRPGAMSSSAPMRPGTTPTITPPPTRRTLWTMPTPPRWRA